MTKETTMQKTAKLSKAMQDALSRISQAGGHGYGECAYLGRRTAEALSRRGLVVLGTRRPTGDRRSIPWAVATGAEAPIDFVSFEEERRQWAELKRRIQVRRDALLERMRARAESKGYDTGAEWEEKARKAIADMGCQAIEDYMNEQEGN